MIAPATHLAYIDPQTTHHVFTILAPVIGGICFILGILAWPFRCALARAWARLRRLPPWARAIAIGAPLLAFALAAGILLSALSDDEGTVSAPADSPSAFARVLVLGMDGLDARIVERMMGEGQLPHFAKLAAAGGYARLATCVPPESPVAWSTIATGCGPGEHGVFDFLQRDPKTYTPFLSLRRSTTGLTGTKYLKSRSRDGFWAYATAAGIPTTVIRWPVAFPAEKVNGRFLSGLGAPDLLGGEGRYCHFTSEPVGADDPLPASVMAVTWDGRSAATEIPGPSTGRDRHANLAIVLERAGEDAVSIRVAGAEPVTATLGAWSPWVPVAFPVGFGKVHGLVKFMLTEVDPHLKLTASPIHMHPAKQAFAFTCPASFGAELFEKLGPFHTLGLPEQTHPVGHGRYGLEAFLEECRAVSAERLRMFEMELACFDEGLLAFVFDTSDRIQHMFWAAGDPQHPAHDPELARKYADVIPGMYREMDDVLGRAMSKLDDSSALVVLSDHGFETFRRAAHVNRWLIANGYMQLTGDSAREGREILQDVDWSRTKAYAMGFGSVYLNLQGREGQGIVEPGEAAGRLLKDIADGLRSWRDADTGASVVRGVYPGSEVNRGAHSADGPDLVLGFDLGYRASWQTALGGAPVELLEDNLKPWSGDHLVDPSLVPGVVFCNRRIVKDSPRLQDVAPTVLRCLGLEPPAHMEGKPLF